MAQVQADVSHEEWKRRELTILRREKMEQLMTAALEAPEWSLRSAQYVWGVGSEPPRPDPASLVDSVSICYFPFVRRVFASRMSVMR